MSYSLLHYLAAILLLGSIGCEKSPVVVKGPFLEHETLGFTIGLPPHLADEGWTLDAKMDVSRLEHTYRFSVLPPNDFPQDQFALRVSASQFSGLGLAEEALGPKKFVNSSRNHWFKNRWVVESFEDAFVSYQIDDNEAAETYGVFVVDDWGKKPHGIKLIGCYTAMVVYDNLRIWGRNCILTDANGLPELRPLLQKSLPFPLGTFVSSKTDYKQQSFADISSMLQFKSLLPKYKEIMRTLAFTNKETISETADSSNENLSISIFP